MRRCIKCGNKKKKKLVGQKWIFLRKCKNRKLPPITTLKKIPIYIGTLWCYIALWNLWRQTDAHVYATHSYDKNATYCGVVCRESSIAVACYYILYALLCYSNALLTHFSRVLYHTVSHRATEPYVEEFLFFLLLLRFYLRLRCARAHVRFPS